MRIKSFRLSFLFLFFMAFCTLLIQAQTTVIGTSNPAVDVSAVQNAVDTYKTVYLRGSFDFGVDYVRITKPDVTLTALALGDATITGIMWDQRLDGIFGKDNPREGMIHVEGDGITLPTGFTMTNLIFECGNLLFRSAAVSIYNIEVPNNITTIRNNIIRDINWQAYGLHPAWVHGKIYIQNNEFSGYRPFTTYQMGGGTPNELLEVGHNTFKEDFQAAIWLHRSYMVVDVHHNEIIGGMVGILSYNWGITDYSGDPPYYPRNPEDEPPTFIRNNFFNLCSLSPIYLGQNSDAAINHHIIENTLTGFSQRGGIWLNPLSMYNTITNNDLSGHSSRGEQISIAGVGHTVTDNILGNAANSNLPPILIYTRNATGWWGSVIPHDTYGIVLMNNDYRNADVPGWETGLGCIIVGDDRNYPAFPMRFVRDCLIFEEGRFPGGTGGTKKQVLNLQPPLGLSINNRIVGLPPHYVPVPGIGQKMKEAREELDALLVELEEEIKK